jgi:RNA polymerase primary sigma factor
MRQFKSSQHITGRSSVSVNNYLRDVNRYPMATLEEEVQLAQAIRDGGKEGECARQRLIEANLRFVITCAIEMATPFVPIEELIAAGNYGLTVAANRYDPSYDNHFCSYAVHHIRKSIREAIKAWACSVSIPDLLQGLQACLSLDERGDEDEDNWSRDLIDRIPSSPMSSDVRRDVAEAKEQLRSFLSKWYYPSDVQLLMDLAQMMYDGYTVSDLAKKHGLPTKRMKSIIADLREKALLHQLQTAFQKAA